MQVEIRDGGPPRVGRHLRQVRLRQRLLVPELQQPLVFPRHRHERPRLQWGVWFVSAAEPGGECLQRVQPALPEHLLHLRRQRLVECFGDRPHPAQDRLHRRVDCEVPAPGEPQLLRAPGKALRCRQRFRRPRDQRRCRRLQIPDAADHHQLAVGDRPKRPYVAVRFKQDRLVVYPLMRGAHRRGARRGLEDRPDRPAHPSAVVFNGRHGRNDCLRPGLTDVHVDQSDGHRVLQQRRHAVDDPLDGQLRFRLDLEQWVLHQPPGIGLQLVEQVLVRPGVPANVEQRVGRQPGGRVGPLLRQRIRNDNRRRQDGDDPRTATWHGAPPPRSPVLPGTPRSGRQRSSRFLKVQSLLEPIVGSGLLRSYTLTNGS